MEAQAGRNFTDFIAVHYRSQEVAGTNYFVKVHTGDEKYIHVRIYEPLPGRGDTSLHSIQNDKAKEEEVQYFQ